MFNSSRWWDFRSPWLLDQEDVLARLAPTVGFPEDHNTGRLAAEIGSDDPQEIERHYRFRYLFAAAFSTGVLMPMGFEHGCRRPLNPVDTRPEDWRAETASPLIDITGFVGEVNAAKASAPALTSPRPQRRVTAPSARVVGLMRIDTGSVVTAGAAEILLVNPDPGHADGLDPSDLLMAAGGRFPQPGGRDARPCGQGGDARPRPHPRAARDPAPRGPGRPSPSGARSSPRASERLLQELAANRVAIEKVEPELDGGRFAVKRVVGDVLEVQADIFCDGHDKIAACICYRPQDERAWRETPMRLVDNDRWGGSFPLTRNCRYLYTIEAWRDLFASWCAEVSKKHDAGQSDRARAARGQGARRADGGRGLGRGPRGAGPAAREPGVARGRPWRHAGGAALRGDAACMARNGLRTNRSRYERELEVVVDRTPRPSPPGTS